MAVPAATASAHELVGEDAPAAAWAHRHVNRVAPAMDLLAVVAPVAARADMEADKDVLPMRVTQAMHWPGIVDSFFANIQLAADRLLEGLFVTARALPCSA